MKFSFFRNVNLFLALIAFSCPASATPQVPASTPAPSMPLSIEDLLPKDEETDVSSRAYVNPDYTNLAKSLWAFNAFSFTDDDAVDSFLKITECDLYNRFFNNEFEWAKIRNATRDYLKKYKNSFPQRYEYIQPLMLDRYDFSLKGFRLMPGYEFETSSKLEMGSKLNQKTECRIAAINKMSGYSESMMVLLKQPFRLSFVRVNEKLAQEYLKMLSERNADIQDGRQAYIRFRIKFDRYAGNQDGVNTTYAVFGGELESVEVFATRDLTFKLYEQTLN